MSVIVPQLSSPCGYYGEHVLQQLMSPMVSAVLARESLDYTSTCAVARSHFCGLRLFRDGSSWHLEALVPGTATPNGGAWVPFAAPLVTGGEAHSEEFALSYVPRKESSAMPLSPQEVQDFHRVWNESISVEQSFASQLRAPLLRKFGKHDPQQLVMKQPPGILSAARDVSDWLHRNRKFLLHLRASDVNAALDDLGSCLLAAWRTNGGEDQFEICKLVQANADVISFLSKLFRLHWYVGHQDWPDVLSTLDGSFPQTSPPSPAWVEVIKSDSRMAEAIAKPWLWPWVYSRLKSIDDEYDACVTFEEHSLEGPSGIPLRTALIALGEWWPGRICNQFLRLVIVPRSEIVENESRTSEQKESSELFHSLNVFDGRLEQAINSRLDDYEHGLIERDVARHDRAFPSVGSDLSIAQLRDFDRLGWAVRAFETEIEGENAWDRCIANAVFEDAFGPQAIARRIEGSATRRMYGVFGRDALMMQLKRDSDEQEKNLGEFVRRALPYWHGENWLMDGVPEKVRQEAEKTAQRKRVTCDSGGDWLFRCLNLSDYDSVLRHEPNWERLVPYLKHVGFERPTKSSFKMISDWTHKIRNPVSHPEPNLTLSAEAVSDLARIRNVLLTWLILLEEEINKTRAS